MGFFDFISKTVDVVKGVVVDNPIINRLGSVASIITHAIPGVGPVIDAATPALNAIFSQDSKAERISDPSDPAVLNSEKPGVQVT
ncbi:hypothetical protein GLAREA_11594 [Glarea lozoyensis ATCC 20868]|uniref:Uncharacterized protein n=1 Tax=Glarea lozoyensis (strain ATCC 20868 / MF5171) TaxID=1116229 RepID=S3DEC3_GLAL2|nr:uncharacterized protein GLAREA_11594 [Glarea lozoyensis ATCC 20868]EPE25013.1 hypothetical protein GLAREA_11594 [Glarea lozoyensis ATCC 20868]